MIFKRSSSGQAIVLIVFAIIGLIGFTALAIDSGNAFADRRKAQSAADNAALAAALAKVNDQNINDAALAITQENNRPDGTVTLTNPPGPGCDGTTTNPVNPLDPDDELSFYIQVVIRSSVDTYFGPIIGINQVQNCVQAIARAKPVIYQPIGLGATVAGLQCTGDYTVAVSGSSQVTLLDGGLFSNSNSTEAAYVHSVGNLVAPNITATGCVSVPETNTIPVTCNADPIPCPLPDEMIPEYTCDYNYDDFPPDPFDDHVTPGVGGIVNLAPGVYCISGEFPKTNVHGVGVTLVMLNYGLDWNGNVDVDLTAATSGPTTGLLIYLPPENNSEIRFNGTAGLNITGSVFAPSSRIVLAGDFGVDAIQGQWVGNTIDMTGNVIATLQYNASKSYKFPEPPDLELAH